MTNLLVAVLLGLLAAVHTTPVNTVTLTKADNDVFQEVMENEFLIPSLTTQTPKNNPSIQASQLPPFDFKKDETMVSTRDTDDSMTPNLFTTQSHQSAEETGLKKETEILDSTNTNNLLNEANPALSSSTPGTAGDEDSDLGSGTNANAMESNPAAKITMHTMFDIKSGRGAILHQNSGPPATEGDEDLDLGSGTNEENVESTTHTMSTNQQSTATNSNIKSRRGHILDQNPATTSSPTSTPIKETSAASSTSSGGSGMNVDVVKSTASSTAATVIKEKEIRRLNIAQAFVEIPEDNKPSSDDASSNKARRTQGWIVILACLMGVAVLVIVCVAIVTRERWYGPTQVYQVETKTGQQREQELETFLQNDTPKENRISAEYTVIPLDDLPQSYTSHATH